MKAANTLTATTIERDGSRDGLSYVAPAALLLAIVIASPIASPAWASMLVNCGALLLGLKHYVWLASTNSTHAATAADRVAFYLLWPGLDVAAFLNHRATAPHRSNWLAAAANTVAAAGLLWIGIPLLQTVASPFVVGLSAMLVGTLLFHSGLFHFVALLWQTAGRAVTPIMNRPLAADSLVDFWSRRWNLAFRDAAALLIFRPIARRWGATIAMAGTFLASGLFHEVVISLPARGGYGLPTIYFLIQFAGTIIQRHFISRNETHWHLPTRLTTALVILTPLPLLFHPPFCERVIIPFLHVLGVL